MWDERLVGRRHGIVAQAIGPDPGQPRMLARRDSSAPAPAQIERHQQVEVGIGVARKRERRQTRLVHPDAQLPVELAGERVLAAPPPPPPPPPTIPQTSPPLLP